MRTSMPHDDLDDLDDRADLAALEAFRFDVPAADPVTLVRARRRLLVRAAGPRIALSRRRGRAPVRRFAMTVAAVAALTAGALALDSASVPGRDPGASAEASVLLTRAADAAIGAKDPVVKPGQYLRVRTRAVTSAASSVAGTPRIWLEAETFEQYVPGDPAAEWVLRRSGRTPTQFFSADDERAVRAAAPTGPDDLAGTLRARDGAFYGPVTASWQTPTKPWLDSLPRDPKALLDRIYRDSKGAGNSKHGEAVVVIADVLRSGIVPGDLRAALFRAATLVPGVEVLDGQAVLDGRRGVSVGRFETANGLRQEIVFDPATGQVIGERQVAVKPKADFRVPPGAVVSSTAVRTDVVATAP